MSNVKSVVHVFVAVWCRLDSQLNLCGLKLKSDDQQILLYKLFLNLVYMKCGGNGKHWEETTDFRYSVLFRISLFFHFLFYIWMLLHIHNAPQEP